MEIDLDKLLAGGYEAEQLNEGRFLEGIVPDFGYNVLNPLGLLYRPVVDEAYLDKGGVRPRWPDGRPFAVCLTHDVDFMAPQSAREARRAAKMLSGKAAARHALSKGAAYLMGKGGNRDGLFVDSLNPWLDVEREVGVRSTFFVGSGFSGVTKRHVSDLTYELSDTVVFAGGEREVGEVFRLIHSQGWEIGLHPAWHSFDDGAAMARERERLEDSIGSDVVSVRQHYLHYDVRCTPSAQARAGLRYDSTGGFNDNVGFRFGTCYPWRFRGERAAAGTSVLEVPLIVQDSAMLNPSKGLRLDTETAFRYVLRLASAVEGVGGVLTLSWHAGYGVRKDSFQLYGRVLEALAKNGPWFAPAKEIGRWWERENESGPAGR